jgi:Resolvase, N terminal domain
MVAELEERIARRADQAKLVQGQAAETAALPAPVETLKPRRPNKVMEAADTAIGPRERKPRKRKAKPPQTEKAKAECPAARSARRCTSGFSTDAQTVENQIRELRQVAKRRGWDVVDVYKDAGISGAKGRNGRPGLDAMLKDASRRNFDILMAWAIDRVAAP